MQEQATETLLPPIIVTRNGVDLKYVEGRKLKGKDKAPVYIPEKFTAENWPTVVAHLGEDYVRDTVYGAIRRVSINATKEASTACNNQGEEVEKDFSPDEFKSFMTELQIRGDSMEDLMNQREELMEEFAKLGGELEVAGDAGDMAMMQKLIKDVAKIKNELAQVKANIERKSRKRKNTEPAVA